MQRLASIFGKVPVVFEWSGENTPRARGGAARDLAAALKGESSIHLFGFSHGGNVAWDAAIMLRGGSVETLVTMATPVLKTRSAGTAAAATHVHLYSKRDLLQRVGGDWLRLPRVGCFGWAARAWPEHPGVRNIQVEGPAASRGVTGRHGDILWWDETWDRLARVLSESPRTPSQSV